jgi:VIT1/CCC1 family predicted Fe2+/Mn2+ transporter
MGSEELWMPALTRLSFGSTAGIVTSMGLISGLTAADGSKAALLASLLVIAIADNLTDSLAIHIYQESEKLESRQAFRSTVANFFARLLVASSFVVLAWLLPVSLVVPCGIAWGMALLGTLTFFVARHRGIPPLIEVGKHVGVAVVVIAVSKALGAFITAHVS